MPNKKIIDPAKEGGDTSDLSQDIEDILSSFSHQESKVATSHTRQPIGCNDLGYRSYYRHPVHWRVAIVNKSSSGNEIFHGRTNDLSMSGISILLDHNILFTSEVVVLLAIPPMHHGLKETIIEIECSLAHSVLDSVHGQFRFGMRFLYFKGDSKRILSDVLSKRHIPKQEATKNYR
jgi:hypothetical protein